MFKQGFNAHHSHPMRTTLRAAALAVGLVSAQAATAASADYYVQYSISASPAQFAATSVTLDGQTLVKPAGACGMRFEYPEDADWVVPVYDDVDTHTQGHINVWLPSDDCGAWTNIVVEADDDDADDVGFPPYGVPGTLRVLDAYAYWIDSGGNKLVYKHCCGADYVYGNELRALERQAPAELGAIKRLLRGGPSTLGNLTEQLAQSEQTLRAISRELTYAIQQRRTQFADRIERSVRQLEDDATAAVNAALAAQVNCRNSSKAGDGVNAFYACDAAIDAVKRAGAATDTAHNWLR